MPVGTMYRFALMRVARARRVLLAVATLLAAQSAGAQAPRTAADSMLAIIRARAGIVDTPARSARTARTAATPTTVRRPAPAPKPAPVAAKKDTAVAVVAAPAAPTVPQVVEKKDSVVAVVAVAPAPAPDTVPAKPAPVVDSVRPEATPAFPAKPAAEPTPTPAAPTPAAPRPAAPAPAAPARIAEVGFGTLKFDGLLQLQFGASNTAAASSFRIRRAEIKVSGRISPLVGWAMMFDVSKPLSLSNSTANVGGSTVVTSSSVNQGSRLMQDAILTVDIAPQVHVDAGQFRLPLGNIGSGSSANLETIERPMFQADRARGGNLGDVRDVGFVVRGTALKRYDWWVGAFNGAGESQNTTDANNQKAVVGRVSVETPVDGLRVGASGLYSGFEIQEAPRRDRYGAEVTYQHTKYLARVEAFHGIDGAVDRVGGFVLLGYKVRPAVQVVTRVDAFDPNIRVDNTAATARATDYLVGATWGLAGDNAKLQLNLSHREFAGGITPAANLLSLNLQASW